jgi:hypothetical protein
MRKGVKRRVVQHYGDDVYEPIKIIEHYDLGFNRGNALKYILRAGIKSDDPMADIEKAMNYLHRELHGEWMPVHESK